VPYLHVMETVNGLKGMQSGKYVHRIEELLNKLGKRVELRYYDILTTVIFIVMILICIINAHTHCCNQGLGMYMFCEHVHQ
jgi:hypothetical protein